jgi:hypothetical protein
MAYSQDISPSIAINSIITVCLEFWQLFLPTTGRRPRTRDLRCGLDRRNQYKVSRLVGRRNHVAVVISGAAQL